MLLAEEKALDKLGRTDCLGCLPSLAFRIEA
jgi:hypothetical protein